MLKSFWSNLHLGAWVLFSWLLPWQTKLIIRSAESNYWEIAIFLAIFVFILVITIFLFLNKRNLNKPDKWFLILSLAVLMTSIVSGIFSLDPYLSLYRSFLILCSLVLFYCLLQLPKKWHYYLLLAFLISLAFQAIIGLCQFFTQSSFASTILGIAYHFAGEAGTSVIEISSGRWLRTYGASDHPNIFGGLMAVAACLSIYLWQKTNNIIKQRIFLSFFLLFIAALIVSFSRAAYLAFSLACLVFVLENIKNWKRLLLPILSAMLLSSLFFFQYSDLLTSRFNSNERLEQISVKERNDLNKKAWYNWKNNFWFGVGLNNSTLLDKRNDIVLNKAQPAWAYQPAHNYWLLIALEGGIFFFLSLFSFWLFFYQKSRSRKFTAIFIVFFVLSLFDHWLFSLPLSSFWFFFVLALI